MNMGVSMIPSHLRLTKLLCCGRDLVFCSCERKMRGYREMKGEAIKILGDWTLHLGEKSVRNPSDN